MLSPRRCLALLAVLTLFHTWPLSAFPATASLNHHADAQLLEWTLSWIGRALAHAPGHLFDGNIFAPEPRVLTLSDPLLVPAVIGAPAQWLGSSPVLVYNLVQLIGLTLTAWAAWFVGWRWTASTGAGLVAGALAAFNVHTLARLAHVQATHAWTLPLTLYFADRVVRRPTPRDAAVLAALVAGAALTSVYTLMFVAVVVAVVMLASLRHPGGVAALGVAAAAGLLGAVPLLWPYVELGRSGASRPLSVVAAFSARPSAYLHGNSLVHRWLTGATTQDELQLMFAGVVAIALASTGALSMIVRRPPSDAIADTRRRLSMLLLLAAAGVLLSFGPATPVYRGLYDLAMPLRGLRAVARFGYLYLLAVALLAAFGVSAVERSLSSRRAATLVPIGLLTLITMEAWTGPIRTEPFRGVPPIYAILAEQTAPVMLVEVPFFPADAVFQNGEYVLNATGHWKPVMNGYSGATPASYRRRAAAFWYFPRDWAIDAIKAEGATHVMVHLERFDERDRNDIAAALPGRTDLRLVASDAMGHRLYEVRR